MLFLGIDLHLRQMTISLRNPGGDVLLRRQVSTRWPKLEEFREQLRQVAAGDEKYVAILEVCGFHDWLVKWLHQDARCQLVLVVQPLGRSATKTDRRDAHALSEVLWINRERLLRGDRVHGVRTVHVPGEEQMADRRLTSMRERLVRRRTQTINQIHKILRRQNREWDRPTKTFQTQKVAAWLTRLELEPMDRLLLNQLLVQWKLWEERSGVKVEITALPWGEALERMRAGEFDVIDTIFDTKERARYWDFTRRYARIEVPIFFREDMSGITGVGMWISSPFSSLKYLLPQPPPILTTGPSGVSITSHVSMG